MDGSLHIKIKQLAELIRSPGFKSRRILFQPVNDDFWFLLDPYPFSAWVCKEKDFFSNTDTVKPKARKAAATMR
jgi:hypothetical protein